MNRVMRRLARRLGWDRNPLRRRADRVEAAVVTALLAAFLIGTPVLGVLGGRLADQAALRGQRAERTWRLVPATLLENASGQAALAAPDGGAWVAAHWTAPGGQRRTGVIEVSPLVLAGQRVQVWVDPAGQLTPAPSGEEPPR